MKLVNSKYIQKIKFRARNAIKHLLFPKMGNVCNHCATNDTSVVSSVGLKLINNFDMKMQRTNINSNYDLKYFVALDWLTL